MNLKKFEIWIEGFRYGGDTVTARKVADYLGYDFRDAVMRYYSRYPVNTFDPLTLTDYVCKLHPTEAEARKYCG